MNFFSVSIILKYSKFNIKGVFLKNIRDGCLISWLLDLNKNLRALYSLNFESLTNKSGFKMLFGQTNNKLSRFLQLWWKNYLHKKWNKNIFISWLVDLNKNPRPL